MYEVLLVVFLIVSVALVGTIMLQQGRGSDIGGTSFKSISSGTFFSLPGSTSFMTRTTTIFGILFFSISLALSNISSNKSKNNWENLNEPIKSELDKKINEPIKSELDKPIYDIPQ